jgi:hypothetical protein
MSADFRTDAGTLVGPARPLVYEYGPAIAS